MIHARRVRTALLATLCLAFPLFVPCALRAQSSADYCMPKNLKNAVTVAGYKFQSYENDLMGLACFQVIHNGKVIFKKTNDNDGSFWIGQHPSQDSDGNSPEIPDGTDITGLGYPDMIVQTWNGGTHCCFSDYLFQLKPKFHLLAHLHGDDATPHFGGPDRNGHYYFYANDWTLAYWLSSFAGSPTAPVILKFVKQGTSGSYHLALDKMRKPPPTPKQWNEDLKEARTSLQDYGPSADIWSYVMPLIYSGHSDLAWKFLNEAWPAKLRGKAKWTGEFCSLLKTSPYWPDLKVELKNAPPACANAHPPPLLPAPHILTSNQNLSGHARKPLSHLPSFVPPAKIPQDRNHPKP